MESRTNNNLKTKTKMKPFKLKTILSVLMLSVLIGSAVSAFSDVPLVQSIGYSILGVEALALLTTEFGAKRMALGAGMLLGANVYADTVLLDAQAFISNEKNKKFQTRPEFTKVMPVFMKDREFTIPNLAALRLSDTRPTEAMYLKKKDFTITTTGKTCAPTGETSGSAKIAVTFTSFQFEIVSSFKQHAGNQVSAQLALANDLWNAENSLWFGADGVDQYLLDYLETNKSGVNNGTSGTFDAVNDIMAITNSNKNLFYNLVTADMQMNNYSPIYNEVHNTAWTADQRFYVNQGGGNSTNTAFQFDGFEFYPSNLLTAGVIGDNTYTSVHYVIPDGGVAILDWNDPLNRATKVQGDKSWYTVESMVRPGFFFDVFKTETCADTTADGGSKQDSVTVWQFTLNIAVAKQPVPTALETTIYKYGVLSGDTFNS